jgi:purine nucleosidase
MARRRVVLDMDVGIDDALAIMLLAAQPEVEIVALGSVHGNIDALRGAENALRVLETCGLPNVPVALGAAQPLACPLFLATHVHGDDGLGNTSLPAPQGRPTGEHAAEQLVRLAHEAPGELDLLAVGPLTNLALALERDPLLLQRFRSTVIMGGAGVENADQPVVGYDANTDHDPEAAEIVYRAPGERVMVGIDVTNRAVLAGDDLARINAATTPQGQLAWRILQVYLDVYERRLGFRGCAMHDPLAAAILLDPSLATEAVVGPVGVVGSARGKRAVLQPQLQHPPTRVVREADYARFMARMLAALEARLAYTT